MQTPIVYRDGVTVIAVGSGYADIRYGVSHRDDSEHVLVLNQDQARELAAALTWIISEVDEKHGYNSFAPRRRIARADAKTDARKG